MEIVRAQESHVPEIVELWKEFEDFHRDIDPFFTRSKEGYHIFGKYVSGLLDRDDHQVLVAVDEGRAVAFSISRISYRPPVFEHAKYAEITDLAVTPSHRRKGIGTLILKNILEWFESQGLDRIELRVLARNQVAYSFWRKQGFTDYIHILYLYTSQSSSHV